MMWAENIGFPFENFKTPSTFSVCYHLMHCPSISCTSNFYENLKRFLVDSLITFPLTTCMCASHMEVIVIKRKLVWFLNVPFHFHFGRRGRGRPGEYIKADSIYKFMLLLDFVKYELVLISAQHIFACLRLGSTFFSILQK